MEAAQENLEAARELAGDESQQADAPEEVVADKGYHSRAVMLALQLAGLRSDISEPRRKRQQWEGQRAERDAVYSNRRRVDPSECCSETIEDLSAIRPGPRGRTLRRPP